jgi:hypothetical protein
MRYDPDRRGEGLVIFGPIPYDNKRSLQEARPPSRTQGLRLNARTVVAEDKVLAA